MKGRYSQGPRREVSGLAGVLLLVVVLARVVDVAVAGRQSVICRGGSCGPLKALLRKECRTWWWPVAAFVGE